MAAFRVSAYIYAQYSFILGIDVAQEGEERSRPTRAAFGPLAWDKAQSPVSETYASDLTKDDFRH